MRTYRPPFTVEHRVLAPIYSCALYRELPSTLTGLTAEFGMGSGVTPSLEAPGLCVL